MKKHQIFWLVFSCLIATNFLSYTMEEGDIPYKEVDDINKESTIDNHDLNLLTYLSYLEEQNKDNIDPAEFYLLVAVQNSKKNKQNALNQLSAQSKLINKECIKGFIFRQAISLLVGIREMVGKKYDWNTFFIKTFNEFYQTTINKKKLKKYLLDLSTTYLPGVLDDIRMNLLGTLLFEELTEQLEELPHSIITDLESQISLLSISSLNVWKLLQYQAFLHFFINQYLYKYQGN